MVERQLRGRGISDERVLAAMATVPREEFVPEEHRGRAYRDGALPIGEGQTISQPWIVARMAEALELEGDERVLEIGGGSGYAAAVLAQLCRDVVAIERHPLLARRAAATLERLGYAGVEVREGDGSLGAPDRAPFDGITVAAAVGELPPALREQLATDGVIVYPRRGPGGGEQLVRLVRDVAEPIAEVRFVPLVPGPVPDEPR